MPRNNSPQRRAQRRIRAAMNSSHPTERMLGKVADALQQIRLNEESRLCDACKLPKWECEILAEHDESMSHIFSPMPVTEQLALEEQRADRADETELVFYEDIEEPEREMQMQHFPGHAQDCGMLPSVCYATSGISSAS